MITAKAKPGMRKDAYDDVRGHHPPRPPLAPGTPDDFSLSTPDQIIQQFDKITGLIGLVAHRHLRRSVCWSAASA